MKAFSYTAAVKLIFGDRQIKLLGDKYNGTSDINVASREFDDYNNCLISCKNFMDTLKDGINADQPGPIYIVSSEVNPVYNNDEPALSKDWAMGEISRLWIFDEAMQKTGAIRAVGQARLYATDEPRAVRITN